MRTRLGLVILVLVGAVLALTSQGARAQDVEEITRYDVSIDVQPGGAMLVTERIVVRALGREIRRGIFRDFPTSFPRSSGLGRIEAPFTVRGVMRDGAPEPYSLQATGGPVGRGGVRIRIGDANVFLDPGVYAYEIEYETDRWVSFGEVEDQLYWNVTGNGWSFPIRLATAQIRIAELTDAPRLESWTGVEGSATAGAEGIWNPSTRTADFRTTASLASGEGLTVRLTFPSGQLTPPTESQQDDWFRLDWGGYIDAGYVVLFVIAVYLLMWRRVGIDPAPGPTRLRREPPDGYSGAALGFIESRGYEKSQLSAALVSLALKGAIRIHRDVDDGWELEKLDDSVELDTEERALFEGLLGRRKRVKLEQSNHATLEKGIKAFKRSLSQRLETEYFVNNRRWFVAGLGVSLLGFLALAWRWRFGIEPPAIFLGFWLSFWTVGVVTLLVRLTHLGRMATSVGGAANWAGFAFLALFSTPFVIAEVVVTGLLFTMTASHLVFAAIAIGATNIAFYHLLERPTLKGRGVLDQLDGFRSYLGGEAERDLPRKDSDVEIFQRYLPFAIALGLEARWTDAFESVLAPMMAGNQARSTLPWYHHHGNHAFDSRGFSSSLGSALSSTLSAASSPPQSSGGGGGFSGGGGSSGGGGGGGGGGGW